MKWVFNITSEWNTGKFMPDLALQNFQMSVEYGGGVFSWSGFQLEFNYWDFGIDRDFRNPNS